MRGVLTDRMQKTMSDVEAGEVKAETRKVEQCYTIYDHTQEPEEYEISLDRSLANDTEETEHCWVKGAHPEIPEFTGHCWMRDAHTEDTKDTRYWRVWGTPKQYSGINEHLCVSGPHHRI